MTWKEIKAVTLQKTFAVQGEDTAAGSIALGYQKNMPAAANEGLQLLLTAGRYLKKCVTLLQWEGQQTGTADVARPCVEGVQRYDMRELAPDFYTFDENEVYIEAGQEYGRTAAFSIEGESILILDGSRPGLWRIYYNAYPAAVTAATPDGTVLPLHPEAAVLLPLYMASQLLKEDDPGLAVQYRNEFEVGRETLLAAAAGQKYGKDAFISATGWW